MIKLHGSVLALLLLTCGVVNAIEPAKAGANGSTAPVAATTDDGSLQTKLDRAIRDDPSVAATDVIATVVDGKVTLNGSVTSDALKARAERLAYAIKGVRSVDNRIVVANN
jgi:hyperosmotically inducible protein